MPPPIRLRRTRASAIASAGPTTREPIGGDGAVLGQRRPGGDVRVPDPGPVQVHADAGLVGPAAQGAQVIDREHRAAGEVVGVLHRDRGGADEERAHVGGVHLADRVEVDLAVRVRPGPAGDAGQGAVGTELGADDVRPRLAQDLLARTDQRRDREHVRHGAGRREQRGLVAEHRGHALLQLDDRGVLAVDVVTDLGVGHRAAHGGRRPGQGVRAEVDHVPSVAIRRSTP
jgi:hypothetical protein